MKSLAPRAVLLVLIPSLALFYAPQVAAQTSTLTEGNTSITYPNIIAKVALTNQTQAIPLTTLVTPSSDGLFRISAYMNSPSACSCSYCQ